MDFTYIFAGFIAVMVGLVAAVLFVSFKGRSKLRLIAASFVVAFVLDWMMLVNWAHVGEAPPVVLIFDAVFFAIYSIIGCLIGVFPVLLTRFVWRKWRNAGSAPPT